MNSPSKIDEGPKQNRITPTVTYSVQLINRHISNLLQVYTEKKAEVTCMCRVFNVHVSAAGKD